MDGSLVRLSSVKLPTTVSALQRGRSATDNEQQGGTRVALHLQSSPDRGHTTFILTRSALLCFSNNKEEIMLRNLLTYLLDKLGQQQLDAMNKQSDIRPNVFQFASGHATLWWCSRATLVVSVEDNKQLHSDLTQNKSDNVSDQFARTRGSNIDALSKQKSQFDLLVIDGSHRKDCIENCFNKLSDNGVVAVDSSHWVGLKTCLSMFEERVFRQLEFYGIGPRNGQLWDTSIFYRSNNLFGI